MSRNACRVQKLFAQYTQQTRVMNSFSSLISKRLRLVRTHDSMKKTSFQFPLHQSDCHAFAMPREGQTVHAGVLTTAMGDVTHIHICANDPRNRKAVTTDLNMTFTGVGKVGRTLNIDSSILKIGGTLGVAEVNISEEGTGKLIAVGRHTVMFVGEDDSGTEFSSSLSSCFDV